MDAIDDVSIIRFSENLFPSQVSQCNIKNACVMSLKLAAHVRKDHSKVPRETVCSVISSRTRRIAMRNSPYEALRKLSNMFHIFRLVRQIPRRFRQLWESGWARLIDHPIKLHGQLMWRLSVEYKMAVEMEKVSLLVVLLLRQNHRNGRNAGRQN